MALLTAACKNDSTTAPISNAVVSLPLQTDTDILKFALFLELLESSFYVQAVAGGALSGPVLALATNIRDHENAHVAALQAALGSSSFGTADVGFNFGSTTTSQSSFLATSQALEGTGVGAYLGALASISSRSLRTTAGSIFTIECRHYAVVRAMNNASGGPVAAAFATPMTPASVVAAVQATGFVTKGLG
ncbi:MAG: ferritin-like domain-containing protein [Gemmatimonadaceae bacterium]